MPNRIANILDDEVKNLFKIVVLGFITLDFFSPLTFKFIAMLFNKHDEMRLTFKIFRATYLALPLTVMCAYLIWTKKGGRLFKSLGNLTYGTVAGIALALAFILEIIFIVVCLFFSNEIKSLDLIFYLATCNVGLIVLTAIISGSVHLKPSKHRNNLVATISMLLIIVLMFTLINTDFNNGQRSKKEFTDILVYKIYNLPFEKQSELIGHDSSVAKLDLLRTEIRSHVSAIKIKQGFFEPNRILYSKPLDTLKKRKLPVIETSIKFIHHWNGEADTVAYNFLKSLKDRLILINGLLEKAINNGELLSSDNSSCSQESGIIESYITYLWAHLQSKVNNKQEDAMHASIELLQFEQKVELVVLFTILTLLIFCWMLLSRLKVMMEPNSLQFLKGTVYLYVLMTFQMIKPVNPNHINIRDVGWPFTYSNWYLPNYIQSIGTLNQNIDNTAVNFGDYFENGVGQEELNKLQQSITNMETTINGLSATVDSIKDDTRTINE